MKKQQALKAGLIFGGGFIIFLMLKKAKERNNSSNTASLLGSKKSMDGSETPPPQPTPENAQIVLVAYTDALQAGETPSRLTELNKECMKEFGMRCYVDESGQVVVCDAKGNKII